MILHKVVLLVVLLFGSCAVYGRGILVDGGSSSGADGSGHVGCQAKFLVMVQVMVRMVVLVLSWSDDASGIIVLPMPVVVEMV